MSEQLPFLKIDAALMNVTNAGSPTQTGAATSASSSDDVAVFQKMIEGIVMTGMSLVNGFVGDTIEEIGKDEDGS
ncbi:MAG: hypothetical protein ACRYG8_06985 [Janthinobacterium lividum]